MQLRLKLLIRSLIRLENENPLVSQRQVVKAPLKNPRDDASVPVRQVYNLCCVFSGDCNGIVRALGINHKDFRHPPLKCLERSLNIQRFVPGRNNGADRYQAITRLSSRGLILHDTAVRVDHARCHGRPCIRFCEGPFAPFPHQCQQASIVD